MTRLVATSGQQASVIIPTKNRGALIEVAVDSALSAQAVGEILVVDDASTDDTRARLDRFGSRIRIVEGSFGNAATARNAGAAAANFPLLSFLDSDDEMLPDKIKCLAHAFHDRRVALAHGRIHVINARGDADPAKTASLEALFKKAEQLGTSYASLARHCAMFTSATVLRKDAFDETGGYDGSLPPPYEDLDLYLRLAVKWKLVYERCTVARYRVWRGNFDWVTHAKGTLAVAQKHLNMLESLVPEDERDRARYGFLRRMALSSQTLLRTHDARRFALAAFRAHPVSALKDFSMLRIVIASALPRFILERRRRIT